MSWDDSSWRERPEWEKLTAEEIEEMTQDRISPPEKANPLGVAIWLGLVIIALAIFSVAFYRALGN